MSNVIDLYAGAGGLSLGASRAGFKVVAAVEIDKHAIETYRVIIVNKIDTSKFKIYYTTDLKQNASTLDKSLLEFVKDEQTGIYIVPATSLRP